MTDARQRRTVAIAVLAPLSACVLSLAVDWAVSHDPISTEATGKALPQSRPDPRAAQLRADIHRATAAYKTDRRHLLRLEHEISVRAHQVRVQRAANAARVAAAQAAAEASSSGGYSYVPSGGSSGGSAPASSSGSVPAPPPPPPPPPPTQSTTGASG